jgi:hypothetical protein
VATIANVSYERVKRFLFGSQRRPHYLTYGKDLARALRHFGVRHGQWSTQPSNCLRIKDPALLLAEGDEDVGHWCFLYQRSNGTRVVVDPKHKVLVDLKWINTWEHLPLNQKTVPKLAQRDARLARLKRRPNASKRQKKTR